MKALNNLGWMLLGVAVGSGALYCYNECSCNGGIKQTINKVKKNAEEKLENMMEKQFHYETMVDIFVYHFLLLLLVIN